MALTRTNSNAAVILTFLYKLVSVSLVLGVVKRIHDRLCGIDVFNSCSQVLTEYFKELEEESIRDNFVIIYELLDEMVDWGHVQTTESKILQEYGFSLNFSDF